MPTPRNSNYRNRTTHYYDENSQLILCGQSKKKNNTADSSYHVTCLDCISKMRELAISLQWDNRFLIERARSLLYAAQQLSTHSEVKPPEKDLLPFNATFIVAPLLLAFAIELALKAFICSERPGPPPYTHDLFLLYEALESETQTTLNTRFLIRRPEGPHLFFTPDPTNEPVLAILASHRHLFNSWRYPDLQNLPQHIDVSSLNNVLNFLIDTFYQGWPARQSSFDFPPE